MNLTVINGTNRINNNTSKISTEVMNIATKIGMNASLVSLENFTELFNGIYISTDNASKAQLVDLKSIEKSAILIFVVPTYHHGIPSPLKNFLDIVNSKGLYANSIIGVISSSNKGSSYGANQTQEVLNGILAYNKEPLSFVIPDIPIINYDDIDKQRIQAFLERLVSFTNHSS